MKTMIAPAILVTTLAAICYSQASDSEKSPVSRAAKAALASLSAAQAKAQVEYQSRVKKAAARAVEELEAAKEQALKSSDLAEANRIAAVIDEINSGVLDEGAPLRQRLIGTRWTWFQSEAGANGWIQFNADGTVTCGWHTADAIWTTSGRATVLAKLGQFNTGIQSITFNADLTAAEAVDGAKTDILKRMAAK